MSDGPRATERIELFRESRWKCYCRWTKRSVSIVLENRFNRFTQKSQKYVIPNKTTKSDVDLSGINTTCICHPMKSSSLTAAV